MPYRCLESRFRMFFEQTSTKYVLKSSMRFLLGLIGGYTHAVVMSHDRWLVGIPTASYNHAVVMSHIRWLADITTASSNHAVVISYNRL